MFDRVRNRTIVWASLLLAVSTACSQSSESDDTSAPNTETKADAGAQLDAGRDERGDASAKADSGSSRIGELTDKGVVKQSAKLGLQPAWTCNAVCEEAGGTCVDDTGNGAGYSYGRYTDDSGSFNSRVSNCSDNVSSSDTWKLTQLECNCGGMDIAPSVRVKRSEGQHACQEVCASWGLTCDTSMKSYAFTDEGGSDSTPMTCDTIPEAAAHHYVCNCK